jgi:hypothetical protein
MVMKQNQSNHPVKESTDGETNSGGNRDTLPTLIDNFFNDGSNPTVHEKKF